MSGSAPVSCCQSEWASITTASWSGAASPASNARPRSGVTPKSEKKFGETMPMTAAS